MPLTKVNGQMLDGAITADSSGNVGIGTSSPSSFNAAADNLVVGTTSGNNGITIAGGTTGFSSIYMADGTTGNEAYRGYIEYRHSDDAMALGTAASERMRILSDGGIAIGKTVVSVTTNGVGINPNGQGTGIPALGMGSASNSNSFIGYGMYYNNNVNQWQFYVDWSGVIWARSTTISGLSDRNEKENIRELETGINEVMQLKPKRFDWKDGSKQDLVGFIAQDVQEVLPDLVENYRVEKGQEPRLALRMGDILPTLVKAIQELKAELDATKAEVAELKAKGQ